MSDATLIIEVQAGAAFARLTPVEAVDTLEAESRAYRKAIEHHAEALQVIELRRGVTP